MGSSSGTATTVIKRLPDYAQPFAQAMMVRAKALSDPSSYVPYAGTTFAAQNSTELAAIATLVARGVSGNTTIAKGIAYIEDLLDGLYLLGSDAFFEATEDAIEDNLGPAINTDVVLVLGGSKFAMGNFEGSNLAQTLAATTYTKYFGRIMARLYNENYRAGRTDQHQALALGIEYGAQPIKDAETLRMAGFYDREYRQQLDTDLFNKWVDTQVYKIQHLEILGNAIRALVGAQSTKTEPFYRPSPWIAAAGGAISGAAAGAMIGAEIGEGGGPYGLVIGAIVGAGVGYLSSR
jgi:hypothetical protein